MTRNLGCALIVAITSVLGVRAQAVAPATPAPTDEQQVVAIESEWVQAEIHRDAAVLERVLDDRFLINSSKGGFTDKATAIADVLGWNLVSETITDRTVLVDGDTAIVFGTATFRFAVEGKEDAVSSARYTTAYVKRDGRWRALALHMSPVKTT